MLTDGARAVAHAVIADEFAMTEAAVEGAVRRLRQRYRSLLRDQIAATLDDPTPADVAEEIGICSPPWDADPEKKWDNPPGFRGRFLTIW